MEQGGWGFPGPPASPDALIKQVEGRYNNAQTLSVHFEESYSLLGRKRTPESGTLNLSTLPPAVREALLSGTVHTASLPAPNERDAWLRWIRDRAVAEGVKIAREMFEQVKGTVQGVQVSAPFGKVEVALEVFG